MHQTLHRTMPFGFSGSGWVLYTHRRGASCCRYQPEGVQHTRCTVNDAKSPKGVIMNRAKFRKTRAKQEARLRKVQLVLLPDVSHLTAMWAGDGVAEETIDPFYPHLLGLL